MTLNTYKRINKNCKLRSLGLTPENLEELEKQLIKEKWKSPDTYNREFSPLPTESGVYLFTLIDLFDYKSNPRVGLVAYVGMSKNILKRISSHPTKRKIEKLNLYTKTWFLPYPEEETRNLERELIRRFNPPWNLIGKKIGVEAL